MIPQYQSTKNNHHNIDKQCQEINKKNMISQYQSTKNNHNNIDQQCQGIKKNIMISEWRFSMQNLKALASKKEKREKANVKGFARIPGWPHGVRGMIRHQNNKVTQFVMRVINNYDSCNARKSQNFISVIIIILYKLFS